VENRAKKFFCRIKKVVSNILYIFEMPKATKRSYKKKTWNKRRKKFRPRKRKRRTYIPKQLHPETRMLRHEFNTQVILGPNTTMTGLSNLSMWLYRANVLDDPDYSRSSANEVQPRGFKEASEQYGDYIVTRAVMTATPLYTQTITKKGYTGIRLERHQDAGDTDNNPLGWNYNNTGASAVSVYPETLEENDWIMNRQQVVDTGASGYNHRQHIMKCVYEARKAFGSGYSKNHDYIQHPGNRESRTSLTPDKEKNYYFRIWALLDNNFGQSVAGSIKYIIKIEYDVLWSNKLAREQGQ
jgi:hypothetical protein